MQIFPRDPVSRCFPRSPWNCGCLAVRSKGTCGLFLKAHQSSRRCGRERQGFPFTLCLSPGLHLSSPALGSFLCLRLVRVFAFSSPAVTLTPTSAGRGWKRREMDLVTFVRLLGARVGGAGKKPAGPRGRWGWPRGCSQGSESSVFPHWLSPAPEWSLV